MRFSFFFLTFVILSLVTLSARQEDKNNSHQSSLIRSIETGTWVDQASGFSTASRGLNYMDVVSANVVWAAAYDGVSPTTYIVEFTRTTNGGATWSASGITGYTSSWGTAMIMGTSNLNAWIPVFNATSGGGRILATTNGGTSWVHQTTATFSAPAGFPNVVHFWNDTEGFCMGDPNGGYFEIYTTATDYRCGTYPDCTLCAEQGTQIFWAKEKAPFLYICQIALPLDPMALVDK